jgi:hypothetical protein
VEHEEQAERMEHEADRMEHDSDRLEERIDDTRRDWDAKEQDPAVPGAQPDPDDDAGGAARDQAEDSPGVPGEEEKGTGNPAAAGAEEPDE